MQLRKKALFTVMAAGVMANSFAGHYFKVCYHNQTSSVVYYINDGISHKWQKRGELVGSGQIAANSEKCFGDIKDETMFSTDYITFTLGRSNGKKTYTNWTGIVVPAFSKPYVIAQNATAKKGGVLYDNTSDGHNNYQLHIFIEPDGKIIYSNSGDFTDTSSYITPRFFK